MEAQILSAKDVEVIVKRTDGKTFTLDVPTLNPVDRAYVQKWKATSSPPKASWATTDSDIEITVTLEPVANGDKNPAPGSFVPKVTLYNRETQADFSGLKGTLVLVGQAANNPWKFKVLALEKFSGNVLAGSKYDFTGQACKDAAAQGNQPAYHYRGYFLVLQNANDNVIQFRRAGPFAKTSTDVLKLQTGGTFLTRPPTGAVRARATANANRGQNWQAQTSILPLHLNPAAPADPDTAQ